MGPSDIVFLAAAAGTLPLWADSPTACNNLSDPLYGPNSAYQAIPCTYNNGFATESSIHHCLVLSDCTMVGELDGFMTILFPQPPGNLNEFNLSDCASLAPLPSLYNTTANPVVPGVYSGVAPPVKSRSMFDELDGAGVSWSVYGKGLNSQIHANFCDPECQSTQAARSSRPATRCC